MSNLSEPQFAKYSSIANPDENDILNAWLPRPAHLERHAPGEYQPTLPGMEHMLRGEATHTSVVFKAPHAEVDDDWGDPVGSKMPHNQRMTHENHQDVRVPAQSLRPMQEWLDDNYLHGPDVGGILYDREFGNKPIVEGLAQGNVLQDGHHRAARAILGGQQFVDVKRW